MLESGWRGVIAMAVATNSEILSVGVLMMEPYYLASALRHPIFLETPKDTLGGALVSFMLILRHAVHDRQAPCIHSYRSFQEGRSTLTQPSQGACNILSLRPLWR